MVEFSLEMNTCINKTANHIMREKVTNIQTNQIYFACKCCLACPAEDGHIYALYYIVYVYVLR